MSCGRASTLHLQEHTIHAIIYFMNGPLHLRLEYFSDRLGEAKDIGDQNIRFAELKSDPKLKSDEVAELNKIAREGLREEQLMTLGHLSSLDISPYDDVLPDTVPRLDELYGSLAEKEAELQAIEGGENPTAVLWAERAARFAELSPTKKDELQAAAERHAAESIETERMALSDKIEAIEREIHELEKIIETAGTAWPFPIIVRDGSVESDEEPDGTILLIDEMPGDCIERESDAERASDLIDKYGHTTNMASVTLAAILIENKGRHILPKEPGDIMYQEDEPRFEGMSTAAIDSCKSQRVHRLLQPDGAVIPLLEEKGYTLQRGWRSFIDPKTGKPIQRKRRIYRVVPTSEATDAHEIFQDSVNPNDPGVIIPLVCSRKTRKYAKDTALARRVESDLQEAEEQEFANDTLAAIEELESLGLLPISMEAWQSVGEFQVLLLNKGISRQTLKNYPTAIGSLYRLAFSSKKDTLIDANSILLSAIGSEYMTRRKAKSDREYASRASLAYALLLTHYEQKDCPEG